MKGRKPKPTHLKVVNGNPGKRPLNHDEPAPEKGTNMPSWLSEQAKPYWPDVYAQLDAVGVVTDMDQAALALYCETFAEYISARDTVIKTGTVIKSPKGYPIQSPFVSIRNRAYERLVKMQVEFGMTPSSRSRVKVKKKQDVNPFAKLVKKGTAA